MALITLDERLQLARDICAAPGMQALAQKSHAAVLAELITVGFSATAATQASAKDVRGGHQLEVTTQLIDSGDPKALELRVALSMFTDGLFRGRCQLVLALHERVPMVGGGGSLRGERVGHFCAFVTPVESAFGDEPGAEVELHRAIALLGFGPDQDWAPNLARDVSNAFCEQVAP